MRINTYKSLFSLLCLATLSIMSGCATVGPTSAADPLESLNRSTFQFNETADRVVLKPVAQGFVLVTPQFVRTGLSNVFENVSDVNTAANNLLQGKVRDAGSDLGRIIINSTFGLAGLLDVASSMGFEKHDEDFGQTLGQWGVNSGPYVVLPLLGASTLRDAPARAVDSQLGYTRAIDHVPTRNTSLGIDLINTRSGLLDLGNTVDDAALDKYLFIRDGYLQRRLRKVFDGKVPQQKLDDLEESLDTGTAKK